MPLGTEVGLGPGDIVLDGTELPSPQKRAHPQFSAHLLWPSSGPSQFLLHSSWQSVIGRAPACYFPQ